MSIDDLLPNHWGTHPLVKRFIWPLWARLGFIWFYTEDGWFYLLREDSWPRWRFRVR